MLAYEKATGNWKTVFFLPAKDMLSNLPLPTFLLVERSVTSSVRLYAFEGSQPPLLSPRRLMSIVMLKLVGELCVVIPLPSGTATSGVVV